MTTPRWTFAVVALSCLSGCAGAPDAGRAPSDGETRAALAERIERPRIPAPVRAGDVVVEGRAQVDRVESPDATSRRWWLLLGGAEPCAIRYRFRYFLPGGAELREDDSMEWKELALTPEQPRQAVTAALLDGAIEARLEVKLP